MKTQATHVSNDYTCTCVHNARTLATFGAVETRIRTILAKRWGMTTQRLRLLLAAGVLEATAAGASRQSIKQLAGISYRAVVVAMLVLERDELVTKRSPGRSWFRYLLTPAGRDKVNEYEQEVRTWLANNLPS